MYLTHSHATPWQAMPVCAARLLLTLMQQMHTARRKTTVTNHEQNKKFQSKSVFLEASHCTVAETLLAVLSVGAMLDSLWSICGFVTAV